MPSSRESHVLYTRSELETYQYYKDVIEILKQDKIKSYTWIGNENSFSSISDFKLMYFKNFLPKFTMKTRENYTFKDYKFDHIFICLSPQYIPPIHWHYFNMFKMAYEQISGNSVNIIESTTKKFETFMRHSAVTDEILY